MVSGTISLLLSRCFSPFLHSTRTLSVSLEYLALPDGPGGFAQNSSCSALLRIPLGRSRIRVRDFHPLWSAFPDNSTLRYRTTTWSYNPCEALPQRRFGLFPVRSPLLGESLFSFSSCGYYDVSVPRVGLCLSRCHAFSMTGCPIRKSEDQRSFAPTPRLSQLITSFIA